MSMQVSDHHKDYTNDYLVRLQEEREKAKETGKGQDTENINESIPIPKDEYISSEQSGSRPSGLYHMGKDENGKPKVLYDDPQKAGSADGNEQPKVKSGGRKCDAEEVNGNTDAVDREIEQLKKCKQQLEQQIRKVSGDEETTRELEKKLAQVESELSQKDNDTYRRRHTVFTSRA